MSQWWGDDHSGAYQLWKAENIQGGVCWHFDAHLDIRRDDAIGYRDCGLNCANFLDPALQEGIVAELVWIVPPHLYGAQLWTWTIGELQRWLPVPLEDYASLHWKGGSVRGTLLNRPLTVCPIEHLPAPPEHAPLLLDIDLDYFFDDDDCLWMNPCSYPWPWNRARAVSVAHSVGGGYTAPDQEFLGEVLRSLHRNDDHPWAQVCEQVMKADRMRDPELLPEQLPEMWRHLKARRYAGESVHAQAFDAGSFHFHRRRFSQAEVHLAALDSQEARYFRGLALQAMNRHQEGERIWRTLLDELHRESQKRLVYATLCRSLQQRQAWDELFRLAQQATREYPDCGELWLALGIALQRQGDAQAACRHLRKALRLQGPTTATLETHQELARAYHSSGQVALAQSHACLLRDLDPHCDGSTRLALELFLEPPG